MTQFRAVYSRPDRATEREDYSSSKSDKHPIEQIHIKIQHNRGRARGGNSSYFDVLQVQRGTRFRQLAPRLGYTFLFFRVFEGGFGQRFGVDGSEVGGCGEVGEDVWGVDWYELFPA